MRHGFCLLPTLFLCGCTALYQPPWYVPPPPPAQAATPSDCLAQATRNQPISQGMQGLAIGGGAGAALGAVIGSYFGPVGIAAAWGALAGGVAGGGVGFLRGQQDQEAEYQACLKQLTPASTSPAPPQVQP